MLPRKWHEYARAQAEATALRHCEARRMHDQHRICGEPISHPERYCRVHRDELSGVAMKLERAREASTHARAALAYTMRRLQQGYASYDDAITDMRKYIPVLEEQIKLEDIYLGCFGNPEDILLVDSLKEMVRAAQRQLDEFLAKKEQVYSSLELVLGAAVSGISMYFGIPWGRSVLYGALSAFGLRSGRTGSGRGNESGGDCYWQSPA
ncbi:hypothetical protein C8Q74DRAFT_246379 [Fomes fomentarius]|nr:hypothetical protein C8Q74DRAFT_246379 [Fomes fomentarius]